MRANMRTCVRAGVCVCVEQAWGCGRSIYVRSGITQEQTAPDISAENLCVWVGRDIEKKSNFTRWLLTALEKSLFIFMMKMDFYSRNLGVCVCVCTSFQMRCPSAYQPVESLGTAHHFAAKQQTVTGLFFSFLLSGFFTDVVFNTTSRWKDTSLFVRWRKKNKQMSVFHSNGGWVFPEIVILHHT